ncbi:hypothetical protein [uncultured Empedobacter sp.]|uniref:hypothetical protein n=1 Tax=uncultured Empedobacter sp. TaxID=410844 RepID=UPI0025DA0E5F|nr:hypothetical protein [uncultured Empedobacter sp.]
MTKRIDFNHFFIKVFKEKKYADSFLNQGQLHFSTFDDFRKINDDFRGDPNEGLFVTGSGIYTDLTNQVSTEIDYKLFQNLYNHLCCFYTFNPVEQKVKYFEKVDLLNRKMKQFGDYAVVINNPRGFTKLLENTLNRNPNCFDIGFVNYIDKFKTDNFYTPYTKTNDYDYQNEFRLLNKNKSAFVENTTNIEIGDLNEFGFITEVDKLFDVVFEPIN